MNLLSQYTDSKILKAVLAVLIIGLLAFVACTGSKELAVGPQLSSAELAAQQKAEKESTMLRSWSLGASHVGNKNYQEGIDYLNTALQIDKELNGKNIKYKGIYKYLLQAYQGLGQHDKALEIVEDGINTCFQEDLGMHQQAAYYYSQKQDMDKYLPMAEKMLPWLEDKPEEKKTTLSNLKSYYKQTGANEKALNAVDELLKMTPNNPDLVNERVELIKATGGDEALFVEYEKLHEQNPTDKDVIWQLIRFYEDSDKYNDAITMLDKIIALEAGNVEARERKLTTYLQNLQDETKAMTVLQELAGLVPTEPRYYTEMAQIHLNNERFETSVVTARKALGIKRDHGPAHFICARAVHLTANGNRKSPTSFDDKLVYEIAVKIYQEAAKDPVTRGDAQRQINFLNENFVPTQEDRFMNKGVEKPRPSEYKWILKYFS